MKTQRRRLGISSRALAAALLAAAAATPALAQQVETGNGQVEIDFDINAQPLASALSQYARQSGVSVLFAYGSLDHVQSPALHGRYRRDDALHRLLGQTGWRADVDADGAVRLVRDTRPRQHASAAPSADVDPAPADGGQVQEEIVVTGTRIRGAAPAGANIISLDRSYIDQTGQSTIAGVLQTLPENFAGSQNEATQNSTTIPGRNIAFASTIDLRGLGADATLTLINGRRLAPAGFGNFVDVSAIPLAAVERVEILADGASATYGSDAVGGVVNIITRSHFDGGELQFHTGDVVRGSAPEYGASAVLGRSWRDGGVIAGYEYRRRDALANAARTFAANSDLRNLGGANVSTNQGHPGTIIAVGSSAVTYAIPGGQDGLSLHQSDLVAGAVNFRNGQEGGDLLPQQDTNSAFVSFHQDLTPALTLYFDALASRREAHAFDTQLASTFVTPESNYYRQQNGLFAGQGNLIIAYSFEDDLGPTEYASRSDTFSGVGGARLDLIGGWRLDASLAYGTHRDDTVFSNVLDPTALAAALASNNPATAFNPFSDGGHSNPAVLRHLTLSQVTGNDSDLTVYGVKADGALWSLPGGDARAALGFERRTETFAIDRLNIFASGVRAVSPTQRPGHRTTDAVFAELLLPLIGDTQNLLFANQLDVSLSVRQEHSEDYGTATTPKVGVTWGLTPDLSLRASWGQSFKAPQFQQTLAGVFGTIASAPPAIDPFATNGSTGVLLLTGANRDLEPEQAESWTAGLHYAPHAMPGLRLSATYFDIDFSHRISTPTDIITAIRNPDAFAPFLIRNPTPAQIAQYEALTQQIIGSPPPDGIELIFDSRLTNLAALRVRGIDFEASQVLHFNAGDLTLAAAASDLLQYSRQANAASAPLDVLSTLYNPIDWHARLSATWTTPHWSAGAVLTYSDSYRNPQSNPPARIGAFTIVDLRLAHSWGDNEAVFSVQNLFDEDPPFASTPIGIGFDAANASPLGRALSLQLRHRW